MMLEEPNRSIDQVYFPQSVFSRSFRWRTGNIQSMWESSGAKA
jgi:hypothetical protein